MKQILPDSSSGFIKYIISENVTAFSPLRDAVLPIPVVQAHQVHGDRIAVITSGDTTRAELDGYDALVTGIEGVAIGARTADCIPVLMYDPVNRAIAAVHSGWKGTVLKIAAKTVKMMGETFGSSAGDILAVIGPGIGPDSFQVGQDVVRAFLDAGFPETWTKDRNIRIITDRGPRIPGSMSGGLHIDLWQANRWILNMAGIHDCNIFVSGIDTYTAKDLFSARREGQACGRTVNTIMIQGSGMNARVL